MKYLITESQLDRATDAFLTRLLEPHEEKINSEKDKIFWVKNGEKIALIKGEYFFVKLEIWRLFSSMFSTDFNETRSYIKKWLDEHYNLGELTPKHTVSRLMVVLDEHYRS